MIQCSVFWSLTFSPYYFFIQFCKFKECFYSWDFWTEISSPALFPQNSIQPSNKFISMSTGSSNLESLKSSSRFSLLSTFLAISLSSVCGTTLCPVAHTKSFVCIIDAHPHITMQTEAQPIGAFILHDSTISVEGNKFLFTGFQPQEHWEHSRSEPCSPMSPSTPLAPHPAIS